MGSCKFVNELNRLRKSSSDSIDNVECFDSFKVYMHVTRTAEEDLKNILRSINDSGKKNLILLCGSAGDGKSHLLSYLKNSDEENLLEGYTIYNDATESNSPSKTAIETLNELLDSFKDTNLELPGKNIILAINLGVLSNFIESEYGESYWNLKAYVEKSNILTSKVNDFRIKADIQKKFRNDFRFMLNTGMTSLEDFSNLFSVYYFYYVSQTCISLDRFCDGKRDDTVEFYYALDWEKVSKNRMCCSSGWDRLQSSINHMFSHAITLEIINQTDSDAKWDYIAFREYLEQFPNEDHQIAEEIKKAEDVYCSYVGDYKRFDEVEYSKVANNETEKAIRHLFKCVEAQFLNTERKRANQFYNEKFSEFCKYRWVKNRKKSGLVLNLTERDIIFLTKISLRNEEKIRLNDLYKAYEFRGIYLDNSSKEYLQEFFTKLNLIDKKSDSGDAQYVKRIL